MTRRIWHDYIERAEDVRHSPIGKETYALRSQTTERIFADAKEKHAMRYTPYRGLLAVTAWVRLKFAAMNLKKLALQLFNVYRQRLLSGFLDTSAPAVLMKTYKASSRLASLWGLWVKAQMSELPRISGSIPCSSKIFRMGVLVMSYL